MIADTSVVPVDRIQGAIFRELMAERSPAKLADRKEIGFHTIPRLKAGIKARKF